MRLVIGVAAFAAVAASVAGALPNGSQPLRGCTVPPLRDTAIAWVRSGIVFRRGPLGTILVARPRARTATPLPFAIGTGVLSPDGRRWARTSDQTISVDGVDYRGTDPVWSPDSTRLAYVAGGTIHVAGPPGGDTVVGNGSEPAWSPDGARLVYATADSGQPAIATVAADGGAPLVIWRANDLGVANPAWSANGKTIAFVLVSVLGGDRIATVATDGSDFSEGPVVGSGVGPIRWSPRGRSFAFTSYNAGFGADRVIIVGADGRYRALSDESMQRERFWVDKVDAEWSPDGRSIAYTTEDLTQQGADGPVPGARSEVWIANPRTLSERRLTYHCESPIQHARVLYGTHLADTILVRDGIRETVFCGRGRDLVIADRRDLAAPDCEVVHRR